MRQEEGICVHSTRPQWMQPGSSSPLHGREGAKDGHISTGGKRIHWGLAVLQGKYWVFCKYYPNHFWHPCGVSIYHFHLVRTPKLRVVKWSAPRWDHLYIQFYLTLKLTSLPVGQTYGRAPMAEVRGLTVREEMMERGQARDTQAFWVITPQFFNGHSFHVALTWGPTSECRAWWLRMNTSFRHHHAFERRVPELPLLFVGLWAL